jgi:hypothetical protein
LLLPWPIHTKRRAIVGIAVIAVLETAVILAYMAPLSNRRSPLEIEWHVRAQDASIPPEWRDQGGDRNPLDALYGKLEQFSAQFNWPKTIPFDRSTEIIFIIEGDRRGSGDDLIASFPGDPQKLELRGADQMSARLSAPKGDAEVTPRSDKQERQPVTRLSAAKWIWDVKPERTGRVVLTLEVFAHLQLKSKNKTIPDAVVNVLTKRVEIPITVTLWDRTKTYLAEIDPAWKTVAAIAGGIGALLVFLGLWPRKKASSDIS